MELLTLKRIFGEEARVWGISDAFNKEIKELIEETNLSKKEVVNLLGIKAKDGEKILWRWVNNKTGIPLFAIINLQELRKIDIINKEKLVLSSKNSFKKINIPTTLTNDLAYLIAVISGDGNLTKYFIKITDSDARNLSQIKIIVKGIFGVDIKIRKQSDHKWTVEIDSKTIVDYFNNAWDIPIGNKATKLRIPNAINNADFEIKKAYVQGWFDTEGGIEKWVNPKTKKWYTRVGFTCKNKEIITWLKKELENRDIRVTNIWYSSRAFRFKIGQFKSVKNFMITFGLRHPIKKNKLSYLIEAQQQ